MFGNNPLNRTRISAILGWTLAIGMCMLYAFSFKAKQISEDYNQGLTNLAATLTNSLCKYKANSKEIALIVKNLIPSDSNSIQLAKYITQDVATKIADNNCSIYMVDRSELSTLLHELKWAEEKLVDSSRYTRLGEFRQANVVISGDIAFTSDHVRIFLKALDIRKGITIGQASATLSSPAILTSLRSRMTNTNGDIKLTAPIPEKNSILDWLSNFLITNWQWIWAVIMVPIYGWAIRRLRTRTPAPPSV